jgi:carboxymethylenebutenolidase
MMSIRWDKVQVDGKTMGVYTAVPDMPGPLPCVVVAQHGPGHDNTIQDVVQRLHREGYVAVAPALYHRQPKEVDPKISRVTLLKDNEVIADMNAALAHAKSVATISRAGVTGFCMGGRVAYLMAAANPEFKASVVFYGGNTMKSWGENQGPTPFERSKDIGCPVLGLFGVEDTNPSPDDVKKIDAELTRLGKWHEFHSYQETGHAFCNFLAADRYRDRAAKAGWGEMLAFFNLNLKQGKA